MRIPKIKKPPSTVLVMTSPVAGSPSWPPSPPTTEPQRSDLAYFRIKLPVKTVSESNVREHWRLRAQRAKSQRDITYFLLKNELPLWTFPIPAKIRLTRWAAGTLDTDNLAGSFKHVQDGVAAWLGVDDGDTLYLTWEYAQEKQARGIEPLVEVELWWQRDLVPQPSRPPQRMRGQQPITAATPPPQRQAPPDAKKPTTKTPASQESKPMNAASRGNNGNEISTQSPPPSKPKPKKSAAAPKKA